MPRPKRERASDAVVTVAEASAIVSPAKRKRQTVDDVPQSITPKRSRKTQQHTAVKAEEGLEQIQSTPTRSKRQPNHPPKSEADPDLDEDEDDVDEEIDDTQLKPKKTKSPKKPAVKKREALQANGIESQHLDDGDVEDTPKKKKRKTKEEKEADAMPLAARSSSVRMLVGAHVSMAKGVENAITNAHHIGGNAFALFLKSQRKWDNPPLADTNRDAFINRCKEQSYDPSRVIMPHGSYLVNLAQDDPTKADQAYNAFVDDLHRCEALGIKLYNFHPGAASGTTLSSAITRLAAQLNKALSATKTVIPVLENAAGSGTVIGSTFADLRDIISQISPAHRDRIGVCIDTCHAFAAGYDLRSAATYASVWDDFDKTVGSKYLKALHMNDSKAPLSSKRDLHQNIGLGFLGLRAFHHVMNDARFEGMPLILETPCEKADPADPKGKKTLEDKGIWAKEIKLLESLVGMDAEGDEFKRLERELSDRGRAERARVQKQVDEAEKKRNKKAEKVGKGQKSLVGMLTAKVKEAVDGAESEDETEELEGVAVA